MNASYERANEELLYLFNIGEYYHSFKTFGAHICEMDGKKGCDFTVWCPDVKSVQVLGDFNNWEQEKGLLSSIGKTGVWNGFIKDAKEYDKYKFLITLKNGKKYYKSDPYAFFSEKRPYTASIIKDISYTWHDKKWIETRRKTNHFEKPKNIYEVSLGSWIQHERPKDEKEDNGKDYYYSYKELAKTLIPYAKEMGYTHLELMPIMEYPYDGSWGYQLTGYYSATSRFGKPEEFKYFVDEAHKAGLGIILDWVPGHFCPDEHGLCEFNGGFLYECEKHPQWGTYKFDYNRGEVISFLISNAMFWIEEFHVDALRVDGVSSMLYLNFGVEDEKDYKFNKDGGEENYAAMDFLRKLSTVLGQYYPDVFTVAEESTAWPLVTYPPKDGGLGFHYKWDMGWMNDTLDYFKTDFPFRKGNFSKMTFSMMYAFNENFIMPLSHDEVVHGKCSIINKMPGDYWRKFAGARLLAMYQITHPGGKLNFMGNEIAEFIEWREYEGLEWFLTDYEAHKKHQEFHKALNNFYLKEEILWKEDRSWDGFSWIDANNNEQGILSYIRKCKTKKGREKIAIVVLNTDVQTFHKYRIGVPKSGTYTQVFNSDCLEFGGSGQIMSEPVKARKKKCHGMEYSIEITVPPIGGVVLRRQSR